MELFILFGPLLAAAIAGLGQRFIGDRVAQSLTTGAVMLAAGFSVAILARIGFQHEPAYTIELFRFLDIGPLKSVWSIRVDTLSAVMLVVVNVVSALVHLYSWGYMASDPHRARFFSYLSFFTFSMLALVTADDFIQLFFGWEAVGLASYLLIGFWYKKPSANDAAIKAFVTNRVGDFGFALGIMAVLFVFGTVEFDAVFAAAPSMVGKMITFGPVEVPALELIAFLLFIGAMGKSAQFFLHVWLPDAMEGPTPVSALIHAATMVTAGVFLVCRCSGIYELAPAAATFVTAIGAVTALFAATVGLAQNDIKRVVAYSTCSQLGYMFFAAGLGAYQAAMFHLFTHAFFKALLFLGAGAVIHASHHEQDMRRMGGLWQRLPFTWSMMLIGTLSLTGFGVAGTLFGFSGFFSKDAIIEIAHAGQLVFAGNPARAEVAAFAFWAGIGAALLTTFYSWRLIFMTFHGEGVTKRLFAATPEGMAAEAASHHDDHATAGQAAMHHSTDAHAGVDHNPGHSHAGHGAEGKAGPLVPWTMQLPLFLLACGAIFAGVLFEPFFIGHDQAKFWAGAITALGGNDILHLRHDAPAWVLLAPGAVMAVGFLFAAIFYIFFEGSGAKIAANRGPLHAFLSHKWYFDELYDLVFVKGARALGDLFWKTGDKRIIDGFGPDGLTALARAGSRFTARLQTGYVYHYAFIMLVAFIAFGAFMLFGRAGGGS